MFLSKHKNGTYYIYYKNSKGDRRSRTTKETELNKARTKLRLFKSEEKDVLRKCSKCKRKLSAENFYFDNREKRKYYITICRECSKKYSRNYKANHKDSVSNQNKLYHLCKRRFGEGYLKSPEYQKKIIEDVQKTQLINSLGKAIEKKDSQQIIIIINQLREVRNDTITTG